jgi:large subunit ribosomal protein L9
VIEQRKEDKRREAMGLKERLESEPVVITMRAGANGKLFGSVNNATIAEHLVRDGIELEKKKIEIPDNTLKSVGKYKVVVHLYGDETATMTVVVEASPETDGSAPSRKAVPAPKKTEAPEPSTDAESMEEPDVSAEADGTILDSDDTDEDAESEEPVE